MHYLITKKSLKKSKTKSKSTNNWRWKHDDPKPMGCSKSSSKREVYTNTILLQETRNISNKQPNITPKAIRERRRTTTKKTQS